MSVTPHSLFLFMIWLMVVSVIWIPTLWLTLSIFTPKQLLERYFKEPHFTLTETYMLREFPGFLVRTAIWGWAVVLPSFDRKRKIKNAQDYMPLWYALVLKVYILGTMLTGVIILSLMSFLFAVSERAESGHVFFTLPGHWPGD